MFFFDVFIFKSAAEQFPNSTSEPSLKRVSKLTTTSRVTPYLIEVVPEELLPTIPPKRQY